MVSDEEAGRAGEAGRSGETDRTARTAGQLVKYSREVNQSETVGEVGSYALEATVHVLDGHPSPTVFEVARGDVTVIQSMAPGTGTGDGVGPVARRTRTAGETVIVADGIPVEYDGADTLVAAPGDFDEPIPTGVSLAAPSVFAEEGGDVGVVLLVHWDALEAVESHHVKPVEYLADHLATAVANIRSHERLERARNDLARRKEMIEMYDRLLRHDLGNDLQIVTGYADTLVSEIVEDDRLSATDQIVEHAETIQRTATSAADLIERVGGVVKTLEAESEPEPHDLEPVLSAVVDDVAAKFDSLSVAYDPGDVDATVYAGDLLDSVFANVLSNAAVHTEKAVTVAVSVDAPTPDDVVVALADDGSGVDPDVRDDIFELGMKDPDSDGTGFGLGLVRALVESYGGSVAVGDSDRGGAVFRLTFERA